MAKELFLARRALSFILAGRNVSDRYRGKMHQKLRTAEQKMV
jgi:hypothetical protein